MYVFGEQITATASGGATTGITGLRFIPLPGGAQAVRTGAGASYYFETSDLHGTSVITLNNSLANPVWRQFTPYGAPRSTATGTWPDTNGFLGDPVNAADNLTTIGQRQYDPATGRFLTPDPVLEAGDPTQMGGYAYAADNPVTNSDPTGLSVPGESICTGSVNCNGSGDGPPSGWSGPGTANWNYTGTGQTSTGGPVYIAGNDLIAAPSKSALARAVAAAENDISYGTGFYFEGEVGYPVTSDNAGVRAAIASAICSKDPSWCLSIPPCTSLKCQAEDLLGPLAMFAGVSEGDDDPGLGIDSATASLDEMSASGQAPVGGGYTAAGRAYQKHMGRGELPVVPGAQLDSVGQSLLDEILTNPDTAWAPGTGGKIKGGVYLIMPNGVGAAYTTNLQFVYFGQYRYPGIAP